MLLCASHDTSLLVVTDALLEEVGLASQRDVLHEVEGVGRVVDFDIAESQQQTVSNELDVLAHESSVHAKQSAWQRVAQELLLDLNGLSDDGPDRLWGGLVLEEREEKAGEVSVHALVTGDELVGECKTGHQTALLEPEDRGKRAAEEDTLNSGEGNKTVGKGGVLVGDPSQGPVGLLADAGNVVDGVEEVPALLGLADICVDKQRVGLRVDVLHHDLETVEASCLRDLYFAREALDEVLVDNTIRGCEKGENVGDEEALVVVETLVPVVEILGEIDLLCGPERGFGLLVHLPDL